MRIAICGAHGVGKTTLANALAKELKLHLIEKVARRVAVGLGYASTKNIIAQDIISREAFQHAVLERQLLQEFFLYASGYVSDRSVIDIAAYTTWYSVPGWQGMQKSAIEYAQQNYDLLVYVPLGATLAKDDGFRLTDQKSQRQIDMLITGMIAKSDNVLRLTAESSVQGRMAEVLINA